jgi:hypothetical protein
MQYLAGQAILKKIDIRFVMIDPRKNTNFLVIFFFFNILSSWSNNDFYLYHYFMGYSSNL